MPPNKDTKKSMTSKVAGGATAAGKKGKKSSVGRDVSVESSSSSASSSASGKLPDDLQCGICHDLLDGAVQTPCCGGLSCRQCIEAVAATTNACPYCRATVLYADKILRDVRVERAAACFVRPCKYDVCGYRGKRDELKAHMAACDKRPKDEVIAELRKQLRESDAEWRRQRCWQLSSIFYRFGLKRKNYEEARNQCEMLMCRLYVVCSRDAEESSVDQHPYAPEMKLLPRTHAKLVAPFMKLSHVEDQVLPTACYVMPYGNPGATRRIVIPAKSSEPVVVEGVQLAAGGTQIFLLGKSLRDLGLTDECEYASPKLVRTY
jgi:hypothetical protein